MTTPLNEPVKNEVQRSRLQKALEELLLMALRRGYHGSVGVEVFIQDGTIQHVRQRFERIER